MITGKTNITEWLQFNGAMYWRLKNAAGNFTFGETGEPDGLTVTGSIQLLEQLLDRFGSGRFFIEAWKTPGDKKHWLKTVFEIPAEGSSNVAGIGNIPAPVTDIPGEIKKALDDYKKDCKIETLEARVKALEAEKKELQTEIDSAGNRIANRLEPYLGMIFGENRSLPVISGNRSQEEYQTRIENGIEKLAKLEPDLDYVIEAIAGIAEKEPEKYKMARAMLLNK